MRVGPTYLLTVWAERGDVPVPVRIRRCLKALLRNYGVRVLGIEEVTGMGEKSKGTLPETSPAGRAGQSE